MLTKFYIKLSVFLLAAFFLSLPSLMAQETEPNNTPAQANIIPLNGSQNGAINLAGDVDWYQVTTTADGQVNLTLDNTGNPDLKTLSLYDNDGTTLIISAGVGNGVGGLQIDGLAAGTFYIKINGSSGLETGAYSLSNTLVLPGRANDSEPNNVFSSANILALNDSTQGHIGYYYNGQTDTTDWFKVTTTSDGILQLTYDNTGHQDLKIISLYDNDGITLLTSSAIGNGIGSVQKDGLAAGTYYIKIKGNTTSDFGAYTLSDTLITLARINDPEPDNIFSQAAVLLLNDSAQGHIGYYYNGQTDTTDWYKVTTTSDGILQLTYDNTGHQDLKIISLYDNDGITLLTSSGIGNGIGSVQKDGLAAGTYYIKIKGNSGNEIGDYSIADTLIVPRQTNDVEPNGNFSQADILSLNDSTQGHIGYYYNNRRDTSDWYKITIANRGSLTVLLDNTGNPNLNLNLYDASGTTQVKSTAVGNGIGGFQTDTLAPGVYYVQITGGSGGNNDQFGPYTLSDSLFSALPVTLINFDGRLDNKKVILSWSTAGEINNKGFAVEKSMDGQNFSTIGFVAGKGNSAVVNDYNFNDVKVLSGANFYRLEQTDIDNRFTYSSTIKIDYSRFAWAVLGNPASGNSWIQLQLDRKAHISVQVFSINGKFIQHIDKGNVSPGTYSIPLNINNLSSGMYVIKLTADNRSYTKKINK
jgi:hypothetical protein